MSTTIDGKAAMKLDRMYKNQCIRLVIDVKNDMLLGYPAYKIFTKTVEYDPKLKKPLSCESLRSTTIDY